ncbi:hypothetical protein SLA2020_232060 [Shorea laevis]
MVDSSVGALARALELGLSLTKDEEVDLALDEGDGSEQAGGEPRWCLVGTVLIRKRYNLEAMERTLAEIWRPVRGMHTRILGDNLFAFYFFHPVDLQRVLTNGPWYFVNHVMVLQAAEPGRQVRRDDLFEVPFWIQIYGLPSDRMTVVSSQKIVVELGQLLEVDADDDHIEWDCELGLEMVVVGSPLDKPYLEDLRASSWRMQYRNMANNDHWLWNGVGKAVIEEPWRRSFHPTLESSQLPGQGSSYGNNSNGRDWWRDEELIKFHSFTCQWRNDQITQAKISINQIDWQRNLQCGETLDKVNQGPLILDHQIDAHSLNLSQTYDSTIKESGNGKAVIEAIKRDFLRETLDLNVVQQEGQAQQESAKPVVETGLATLDFHI